MRELTPAEIRQRDAMVDELTELSAILAKVDEMHLRRGELYEALKKLGLTRQDLADIAGLEKVSVDWTAKRFRDRQAGATTSTHRRRATAGSNGAAG